ncbi:hypothetical protein Avbf_03787 [Armadillidium vulgare]|nr:hypothetical protein Avbf_03787 [Armadillidium vulgare]
MDRNSPLSDISVVEDSLLEAIRRPLALSASTPDSLPSPAVIPDPESRNFSGFLDSKFSGFSGAEMDQVEDDSKGHEEEIQQQCQSDNEKDESSESTYATSCEAGSKSHTAKYMCEEISKVIEEIGSRKVIALCTDNASNMKKAWYLLQKKYPALECYGCLAHRLNLIFADCLKIATIDQIITECTTMIKMIKHSHLLLAKFKEKQGEKRTSTTLKLPVKTRISDNS